MVASSPAPPNHTWDKVPGGWLAASGAWLMSRCHLSPGHDDGGGRVLLPNCILLVHTPHYCRLASVHQSHSNNGVSRKLPLSGYQICYIEWFLPQNLVISGYSYLHRSPKLINIRLILNPRKDKTQDFPFHAVSPFSRVSMENSSILSLGQFCDGAIRKNYKLILWGKKLKMNKTTERIFPRGPLLDRKDCKGWGGNKSQLVELVELDKWNSENEWLCYILMEDRISIFQFAHSTLIYVFTLIWSDRTSIYVLVWPWHHLPWVSFDNQINATFRNSDMRLSA